MSSSSYYPDTAVTNKLKTSRISYEFFTNQGDNGS
jgi:hypothetical protein